MLWRRTFFLVLFALTTSVVSGCDNVEQTITSYLDGCRDKQGFLDSVSLQRIKDQPVILGPIEFRAPPGSYSRVARDQAAIFQNIYCDSGDWGINIGNQIRVKLYQGPAPADLYADPPAEQVHMLQRMAAPLGSLDYDVRTSHLPWQAHLELWGYLVPAVRTAYFTTILEKQTVAVSFVAETGAPADTSALVTVVGTMRERNSR